MAVVRSGAPGGAREIIINTTNTPNLNGNNIQTIVEEISELIDSLSNTMTDTWDASDLSLTEDMRGVSSPHDPSTSSNTYKGIGLGTWTNTTSGELFVCTDNTINANKWVGQRGTIISPTGITIEGIENDKMVAHFTFNNITGNKVFSYDNNITANIKNVSSSANAINGTSLYFNGRGTAEISNEELFRFGDFTILYWVNPKDFKANYNHFYKSELNEFSIWQDVEGKVNMKCGDGVSGYRVRSSIPLVLDQYTHISIRRIDGIVSIFFNGVVDTSFTEVGVPIPITGLSGNSVEIGSGNMGNMKGYIDDTYFFGKGLSDLAIEKISTKFVGD